MAGLYKQLGHNDLTKNPTRIEIFLQKIKDSSPFVTTKGSFVIDKSEFESLATDMLKKGLNRPIKGKINGASTSVRYPSEFFKTSEFGGKGIGSGTAAEDAELVSMKKKLQEVFDAEGASVITLKIGKRTVECASVISTPNPGSRAPKSDFSIIDPKGNQVGWISHKAGNKASSFQQYGGLADKAFSNNAEVKKFMNDVLGHVGKRGLVSGESYYRPVHDKDIITMSIYGTDYGKSAGINNVDEFHLGTIKFVKEKKGVYSLTSLHKDVNGDIPSGDFACIYFIRYNARNATAAGITINYSRVGVFANAKKASTSKLI